MSDNSCLLYYRGHQENFDPAELESVMERVGASLYFPGTLDVICLTFEGDQQRCHRADFERHVRASESTSFQWWLSDSEDIYCRVRWVDETCVIEFGLDGLDGSQAGRFISCIRDYAKKLADSGTFIGLVVDLSGVTEQWGKPGPGRPG